MFAIKSRAGSRGRLLRGTWTILVLRNEEPEELSVCLPFSVRPHHQHRNDEDDHDCYAHIDIGGALRLGALEITDFHRDSLPISFTGDLEIAPSYENSETIVSYREIRYNFRKLSAKLLILFRRYLIPGRTYRIAVSGPAMGI